ncbi:MAG: S8 family serine peptidase [Acidobacteria bacterium]|nr:S8 family serine peptidase [Acidobacteriota bacterium]
MDALPTPLRMHADPYHLGRDVTIAMVDSGFYPHRDLTEPVNRIRAWVDATGEPVQARFFSASEQPRWPGWEEGHPTQWHGTMTSVVAAGNGKSSQGLYRGLASEAGVVLIQVAEPTGRIRDGAILRAQRWLAVHAARLRVRVVNLSVAGDEPGSPKNPIDRAVTELVHRGAVVVAASGNDGVRRLLPPATCPDAITVGGLDEQNTLDRSRRLVWHSNYGESIIGSLKPELVAPSISVVGPILPGTADHAEAKELFERRAARKPEIESLIQEKKLITPHYKMVEGTSFAAPIVSSTVACMLEANPSLTPQLVRQCLAQACSRISGAPAEQQGLGAIDSGQAVSQALRAKGGVMEGFSPSPCLTPQGTMFLLRHNSATLVEVFGSWNGWVSGIVARQLRPGLWRAFAPHLRPGRYIYKFLVDHRWMEDPANPRRIPDQHGGYNSVLLIDARG